MFIIYLKKNAALLEALSFDWLLVMLIPELVCVYRSLTPTVWGVQK